MRQNHTVQLDAPMNQGTASYGPYRSTDTTGSRPQRSSTSARFVTQSHALGTPMANPASLIVAAAIAVAVYFVGRRLAD